MRRNNGRSSARQRWWRPLQRSWYGSLLLLLVGLPVLWVAVDTGKRWEIIGALGLLLAGLASNLLANLVQSWRDRARAVQSGGDTYTAARVRYLQGLCTYCQALPLAALGGEEGAEHDVTLDDVYIALDTTTRVAKAEAGQAQHPARAWPGTEPDTVPLSALHVATYTTRLVLLGDPGAGKSTFVRNVLARQATAMLSMGDGPLGLSRDVMPILLTLRDVAPRLACLELDALADQEQRRCLAAAVLQQVVEDVARWAVSDFSPRLEEALTSGRCLLVLDGLDEVPTTPVWLRRRVRDAVGAVLSAYHPQRVIVTCRVRSYDGDAVLPNFQAHTLAPFDDDKMTAFIQAWYAAQQKFGRVDAVQAAQRIHDLQRAVHTPTLRDLASNPMLLTTMALIHQRETRLPEERVCLYSLAVDVLLERWQRSKTGEAELLSHPTLAAVLKDRRRLRTLVEALAYTAHRSMQAGQTVTDVSRGTALQLLEQRAYLGDAGLAATFLDYVDKRAGLLVGRGGAPEHPSTYSFPHRTFQEYLAGCYVIDQRREGRARVFFGHAGEGDFWGLVARLGAEELLYNRRQLHDLLDLTYDLCPAPTPSNTQARRAVLWAGTMAALVGREAIVRDDNPDGGTQYLERLVPRLVTLLGSDLTPPERAEAGDVLARLGDPRFRADAWYLPDEPLLGFVEIPARAFMMGEELPAHEVVLSHYYMARYPVTVAQFQAFVQTSDHKPERTESLQGVLNHPATWVPWRDALAYCDWLTTCLRQWSGTPEPLATLLRDKGWRVTLPSEAEWEKAARGTDGRRYPWGDMPEPNFANYGETHIDTTSTVGCFPGCESPYGVQDMSGNVWEWTWSLYEDYPYQATVEERAVREDLQAPDNTPRVLRGGSSWNTSQGVRCACRYPVVARLFNVNVGFRVVVAGLP